MNKENTLQKLIDEIKEVNDVHALSDEYLKENGSITREEYSNVLEMRYGICFAECDWLLKQLDKVLKYQSKLEKQIENYEFAMEEFEKTVIFPMKDN